MAGFIVTDWNG